MTSRARAIRCTRSSSRSATTTGSRIPRAPGCSRSTARPRRIRDTWKLKDTDGNTVAEIQERKLTIRDAIKIEIQGGRSATVKKALVGIRDRFHVEVNDGEDLKVHGNIVDHEYEIERDGDKIAEVSKKWFRVRDTYGVEVFDDKETVLILAVTVAVDSMSHDVG